MDSLVELLEWMWRSPADEETTFDLERIEDQREGYYLFGSMIERSSEDGWVVVVRGADGGPRNYCAPSQFADLLDERGLFVVAESLRGIVSESGFDRWMSRIDGGRSG